MKSSFSPLQWNTNGSAFHDIVSSSFDQDRLLECYLMLCSANAARRSSGYQAVVRLYESGNRNAGLLVSQCFLAGLGVQQNERAGVLCLENLFAITQDAVNVRAAAATLLGDCYRRGTGVEPSPPEAFRLYAIAAEGGLAVGALMCGSYCQGLWQDVLGSAVDLERAAHYYQVGADLGCPHCRSALSALDEVRLEQNPVLAIASERRPERAGARASARRAASSGRAKRPRHLARDVVVNVGGVRWDPISTPPCSG